MITTWTSLPWGLANQRWTGLSMTPVKSASIRSGDRSKEDPSMDDGGEGWIVERVVVIWEKGRSDLVKLLRNLDPDKRVRYIRKPGMTSATHLSVSKLPHDVMRPTMTHPNPPPPLRDPPPHRSRSSSIYGE